MMPDQPCSVAEAKHSAAATTSSPNSNSNSINSCGSTDMSNEESAAAAIGKWFGLQTPPVGRAEYKLAPPPAKNQTILIERVGFFFAPVVAQTSGSDEAL